MAEQHTLKTLQHAVEAAAAFRCRTPPIWRRPRGQGPPSDIRECLFGREAALVWPPRSRGVRVSR